MTKFAFFKLFMVIMLLVSKSIFSQSPPVISATGNQTYCTGASLNIVQTVNITNDPSAPNTNEVYIQISSGYVLGQDLLSLIGTHPTISSSWSASEGKLKLYSPTGIPVLYSDFVAAIKDVVYTNSSSTPSGTRDFSINLGTGQLSYLPRNKHFYEYVPSLGITWTAAKAAAELKNYYGLQGYLATLTAADEAQLAGAQAPGAGWIGGSDAALEGTWKWVTGPEGLANAGTGTTFWIGQVNGYATAPNFFAFWNTNEPNQFNGNQENYAHITKPGVGILGSWNDLTNTGDATGDYQPKGYVVEYGGMPLDPTLQISASTTITIAQITPTNPNPICGSGSFSLQATTSIGTINWYDSASGGTLLGSGDNFTTPVINTTTFYYADNGCATRTLITATINPIPTITSTNSDSRCDTGSVNLSAAASSGAINWYTLPTGGISINTGNSIKTPILTTTTNYYVDATANGCTSPTRTIVTATINTTPTITSAPSVSRCDIGSVTLSATASGGTINWYDAPTGGSIVNTGSSFITPFLNTTTTYYVEASSLFCTSPRTTILAKINAIPIITSAPSISRCDAGTLTLEATSSAGTINWYDSLTGGTFLGTGTSFTTPILSSDTNYYVDATANGCTSPSRTSITAKVNTTPSITSAPTVSRCDIGSVTLEAIADAGTINWYDAPTGGSLLKTGSSFTTPILTTSTPYYVETINNQCISPRVRVIATVIPITIITEEIILCQSETATLDASIAGMNYLWSPGGETTQTISVSSIGNYSVTISSPVIIQCESKKFITVIEHPAPIINSILVNENSITIELSNPETYYEYSINGIDFQASNQFSYIPSGDYIAYVRETNQCNLVQQNFTIFTISKFFTPNNDGFNDVWEIKELKKFPNSYAIIFDRYGKIIKTLNALKTSWDGTYNNVRLPSDDYWYRLVLGNSNSEMKGHFTLKR